jgi:hypothetical protein
VSAQRKGSLFKHVIRTFTEITRENKREFVKEGMRCEKQDVPRATLTGFRNLAVITMRRLEKMILRKEEELHQKVPNDCVAYDISDTEDSVAELKSFFALQGIVSYNVLF